MAFQKITKRKDGRYCANVTIGINPFTGKVVRKTVYGKTKAEVKNKIIELEKEIARGEVTSTTRTDLTVADWCKQYFETYSMNKTIHTQRKHKTDFNKYIVPYLGEIKLNKLTPIQCQQFLNHLNTETHLSTNSIRHLITFFKGILSKAVEVGFISTNPAQTLETPKKEKPEINPFTEKEVLEFLGYCSNQTIDNMCKFTLFTGLRQHEVMSLTWDNVNGSDLIVDHQFGRNKSDYNFYPTKNKKSRLIGLSQNALNVLSEQKRIQMELRLKSGSYNWNPYNLIFCDKKGNRLHCNSVNRRFKYIVLNMEREDVRFHDLRHTYAVLGLKAGVDIKTISESLGHYSVAFTLDQYAYVTDQMRRDAADKLDNLLNSAMQV